MSEEEVAKGESKPQQGVDEAGDEVALEWGQKVSVLMTVDNDLLCAQRAASCTEDEDEDEDTDKEQRGGKVSITYSLDSRLRVSTACKTRPQSYVRSQGLVIY